MTNNGAPNKPVLLLTRPKAASERLWSRLPIRLQDGLRVVISPIIEIVPHVMTDPVRGKALIFTSAHGVAEAARQAVPRDLPAYVVGQTTAQAATAQGWHVVQTAPTAETLTQALIGEAPPTPLVHLHGTHTRGDIAGRLNRAGLATESRILYDQRACALSEPARTALGGSMPVILPIFSPRSAALLSKQPEPLAPLSVIALSPSVAEAFHHTDICDLHVCAAPTRQAMDAALSDVAMALCRVEGSEGGQ